MKRAVGRWAIQVFLVTALVVSISLFMNGIPLMGVPKAENVVSVELTDSRMGGKTIVLTEPDDIALAVNAANFLNYRWGSPAEDEKIITAAYETETGEKVVLSAGETCVRWKGKTYQLEEERVFVNVMENCFFLREE